MLSNVIAITNLFRLVDTGAEALALINTQVAVYVAQFFIFKAKKLPRLITVKGYNGAPGWDITYSILLTLVLDIRKFDNLAFLITDLGSHDVILGKAWLSHYNVKPDVRRHRLKWPMTFPRHTFWVKPTQVPIQSLFEQGFNSRHLAYLVRRENQIATDERRRAPNPQTYVARMEILRKPSPVPSLARHPLRTVAFSDDVVIIPSPPRLRKSRAHNSLLRSTYLKKHD